MELDDAGRLLSPGFTRRNTRLRDDVKVRKSATLSKSRGAENNSNREDLKMSAQAR